MSIVMAATHTEAVLNKLIKSELVQLALQTEASLASKITNLTTEVKDLLGYFKKLEADLAVTKNVNSKLMERVVQTERQCWANAQYSRRDTIEVIRIPSSIRDHDLEDKVRNIFGEIGVNVNERDMQVCHRLRDNDRKTVKVVNRKDCTNILRVKKDLKHLDPSKLFFSEGTKIFINEVCAAITEAFGINVRSLDQIKSYINFILLMGLFALNWRKTVRLKVQLTCLI